MRLTNQKQKVLVLDQGQKNQKVKIWIKILCNFVNIEEMFDNAVDTCIKTCVKRKKHIHRSNLKCNIQTFSLQ